MKGPLGLDPERLLEEWRHRVRANYEQAERVREAPARPDFYAPIAANFKADPRRTDEPALDVLRGMVIPGETWLDIGAGGGRYALPLALAGAKVIAVDPSDGMLGILEEAAGEFGVEGVEVRHGRWPLEDPPRGDVAFISHVSYDIAEIGPFLDAMEASARRLCVAVLLAEAPATQAAALWPAVHGEERHLLPALPEFLALLLARGKLFSVWLGSRGPMGYPSLETIEKFACQQLFIEPDGPGAAKLREALPRVAKEQDGRFYLSERAAPLGIVSWAP
jgi:SAM-dependent methyltransferase